MKRPQNFLRARIPSVTKPFEARGIERKNSGQCDKSCTALESLQFKTIPKTQITEVQKTLRNKASQQSLKYCDTD